MYFYFNKIEFFVVKMIYLIQDLFNYLSLKDKEWEYVLVDLSKILNLVLQDFDFVIYEKYVFIIMGNLLVIDVILVQMMQLFYNFISNSLKFISLDKKFEIKIFVEYLSEEEVI